MLDGTYTRESKATSQFFFIYKRFKILLVLFHRIFVPKAKYPGLSVRPKISPGSTSKRSEDIDPSDILGLEVKSPDRKGNDLSEFWNFQEIPMRM